MVLTSKKISLLKVAFLKKIWPKNIEKRQKKERFAVAAGVAARYRGGRLYLCTVCFFLKVCQPAQIYRTLGLPERSLRQQ